MNKRKNKRLLARAQFVDWLIFYFPVVVVMVVMVVVCAQTGIEIDL
jgi:hypothetical protein